MKISCTTSRGFWSPGALILCAAATLGMLGFSAHPARAESAVRKSGKLVAAPDATFMVFSSDPVIQQVLSQDINAAQRAAGAATISPQTLTVTVNQQTLQPGVSLEQVAPGAPQVAALIKEAGATPPPLGDTGNQSDQNAVARIQAMNNMRPVDSPMQQVLNQFQSHGDLGPPVPCSEETNPQPGCVQPTPKPQPGSAGYTGDVQDYERQANPNPFHKQDDKAYDTVVVARASLSGSADEMTVVAVIHPGDDVDDAKKLVGEEIANSVLH